ncbi:MAG: hypothetical protein ACR2H3_09120 [Acidimicrobiales bacterium]
MTRIGKAILVVVAAFLGTLFAIGSIIAALFEADGFTSHARDGVRPGYMLALALGLVASVVLPFGLAAYLYPRQRSMLIAMGATVLVLSLGTFAVSAL